MNGLIHFMNTWVGRIARILLGAVIMYAGFVFVGGWVGVVVAAFGMIPMAFGIVGHCMLEIFTPAPANS